MPTLVLWLGRLLWAAVRSIGPNILAVLGISLVTQTVVGNIALPQVQSYFSQLPPQILETVGAMNADRAFSILFSAITVRAGIGGLRRIRMRRRVPA